MRSCEDHIFTLTNLIQNRKSTFVTFVDLQKAFDRVNRDPLQYKLQLNGINGPIYDAISSFYEETFSCVCVNDLRTNWFLCSNGVRQGDNLSLTLFSLFINDLASEISQLNVGIPIGDEKIGLLLYADDIAILSENELEMQRCLDILTDWCMRWRLNVNCAKSNIMHFRKRNIPRSKFNFRIGNEELQYVHQYRYLDVIFYEKMDFNTTAEVLGKSGGRALGAMISKIHNYKDVGFNTYEKLFHSCVVPILDYCSGVWGFKTYHSIEIVQNRVIRYILLRFTHIRAGNYIK